MIYYENLKKIQLNQCIWVFFPLTKDGVGTTENILFSQDIDSTFKLLTVSCPNNRHEESANFILHRQCLDNV